MLQLDCTAKGFYGIEREGVTVPQALLSALLLFFVPRQSPLEWEYSGAHETVVLMKQRVQHFKISAQGFLVALCLPSHSESSFSVLVLV